MSGGDRTLSQVRAQLQALDCALYEVQPLAPRGVDLRLEGIRKWTPAQVEKSIGWLKKMNAGGYDIFIRPAPLENQMASPFVFVDDITQKDVARMKADGFTFAALLESSPRNYHGYIRLQDDPLPRETVSRCGKLLAERYGADPRSFDWRHYGRLSGFTNQKPSRKTDKGAPFVMLRASSSAVAHGGPALVESARQSLAAEECERQTRKETLRTAIRSMGGIEAAFADAWDGARRHNADDLSVRDFSTALSLLRKGYDRDSVADAIRKGSPNLDRRHFDVDDYLSRTTSKAEDIVLSTPTPGR
jgi:hypothetical protein